MLEGAWGFAAAVQRRARLRPSAGPNTADLVSSAMEAAARTWRVTPPPGRWVADSSELAWGETKLGLGSSAAVAAASVAAVAAWSGWNIADAHILHKIFATAREVHWRWQGNKGSGLDVAASTFGGFVAMHAMTPVSWHWPSELRVHFLWTRTPASTSRLLSRVSEFACSRPRQYVEIMRRMGDVSESFASAREPGEFIASVDKYGRLMDALGRAAGVELVDERTRRMMNLASRAGAACKPAGAGGGDLLMVVLEKDADPQALLVAAEEAGFSPIDLPLGGPGVLVDEVERT